MVTWFVVFLMGVPVASQVRHHAGVFGVSGRATGQGGLLIVGLYAPHRQPVAGRTAGFVVANRQSWSLHHSMFTLDTSDICTTVQARVVNVMGQYVASSVRGLWFNGSVRLDFRESLAAGRYFVSILACSGKEWHCDVLVIDDG